MDLKKCSKCLCETNLNNFPIQKQAKDKHSVWCKSCHSEYSKNNCEYNSEIQRKYYENNKDKLKVYCECGKYIFKKNMKNHLQTKIHLKRLQINYDF
jgi:hypothetical protein